MMRMIRWSLILLVLWGCGFGEKKEEKAIETITLAIGYVPNMQFAPLYVGMSEGFFEEEGIILDIEYGMGNDILSLVANKRVDLALGDADQYLIALDNGLPLAAVYQYYYTSPIAIMTFDDRINSPSDLKGKKIGVSELFGSSYLTLLEFLDYHSISPSDVEIVRVGYTQTVALKSGEVNAVVVFANNEPLEMTKYNTHYKLWAAEDFSNLAGAIIMSHAKDMTDQAQKLRIEAFQRALTRSIEYTRNNPEAAASITQQYVDGSSYDDILAGIYATLVYFSENGTINEAQLKLTLERLQALNFIPESQ